MEVVPPFESFRWCFPCFCYWIMFCALQSVAYPMGSTISIISLFLSKCCVSYRFCVLFEIFFMIFLHQVDIQFHLSSFLLLAWSADAAFFWWLMRSASRGSCTWHIFGHRSASFRVPTTTLQEREEQDQQQKATRTPTTARTTAQHDTTQQKAKHRTAKQMFASSFVWSCITGQMMLQTCYAL